jgi:hypothetical protein
MCCMMSKNGYLDDQAQNWHPHLMCFRAIGHEQNLGANLSGSPVLSGDDVFARLTIFMIPVARWSDGTPDLNASNRFEARMTPLPSALR